VAKLTLSNLASLQNETSALATINANSDLIETALENTLSRDGTSPNEMGANLDMNNNRILNLPAPVADQEPLRLVDGQALVDAAELAQDGAEAALASFTDVWLGNQTGDPSTDLDLSALEGGELYFNTTTKRVKVYKLGTGWVDVAPFEDMVLIAAYVVSAAASATAALTSENNAADSASAALADKIAAAASAVAAASSASTAQVMRDQAAASALAAAASALEAAGHSDDAEAAATTAAALLDSFDDRYLGEKGAPPLLDNDGNALLTGALYYDSGSSTLKFYNGTSWITLTNAGLERVQDDIDPHLGNDLDLNNFDIIGVGNIDIDGDIEITGTIHALGGTIDFDDNVNIDGTLNVEGATVIDDTLDVTGDLDLTGNLDVGGAVDITGGMTIGAAISMTSNDPVITLVDSDTGAINRISANNATGSMRLYADLGNTVASSRLFLNVDNADQLELSNTVAAFAVDVTVPDEAYGIGWNASLEAPTKNAVYDKIESILDGETFTGAVVVPDDAYAGGWNGSFEVPTKNAIYDKIESILDGQTFTGAVLVPDDAYAVGWNASTEVPTKNAVYDKIENVIATTQPLDADLTSWAGVTRASGFDTFATTPSLANLGSLLTDEAAGLITFMTTPSSANLRSLITDETGTGVLYFQGGDIGTPSAGVGTNLTGIPLTGLVSDTTTALGIGSINLGHASDTTITRASAGKIAVESSNVLLESGNSHKKAVIITIDGGGATITTGVKGDVRVPWACTITKVTTLLDQTGSIVVDLWKDTYANYPPVDADSITASAPPTVSAALTAEDSTLTGWTTAIAAGDTIRWNVDSITTATRAVIELEVTLTQ
jgi:hypothetical protein